MSAWRPRAADAGAMALLGAAQTLAFVNPSAWWLALLGAAVLAARVTRAAPAQAAWLGWAYGSAWMGAGTWWLFISMHRYGGLPAGLAAAAVALLAALLGLYLAVAMGLFARWRRGRGARDALLFACLWTLAELGRGLVFTGFPWLASGYAQIDGPLATLAPWIGVYGIGTALALAAFALSQGWRGGALVALGLLVLTMAPQPGFTRPGATLSVALLQTGVAQDQKFAPESLPQALQWVQEQLLAADADLVVAPETAVPLLPGQLDDFAPGYWEPLRLAFAAPGRGALVGAPLGDFERGYTNSVIGLSKEGEHRYHKHHLVPFGEFIPTGFRWFTELMNIPLGDFERGAVDQPAWALRDERLAPTICYEDLFGEELARRFARPELAPTMLVNLSNIGWFGDTSAIDQHLAISRMRSLEFQRPMLRSTNTGATALIDHRGQVLARLPSQQKGVLHGRAQGRHGLTPYARWASRFGLWPLIALALLGVAAARARRPRSR